MKPCWQLTTRWVICHSQENSCLGVYYELKIKSSSWWDGFQPVEP
jgi:hypothetical protein